MHAQHILATFRLSMDAAVPKVGGIRTGFSPLHKFKSIAFLASGIHVYPDNELHYPGEIIVTRIGFASWEYMKGHIKIGDRFDVLVGSKLVGSGVVEEIL